MKIYVPSHLRSLEIIDKLCKMISAYAEGPYYEDYSTAWTDFYSVYLKVDSVKRFTSLMITRREDQTEEEYENIISYISSLFYSVKGTFKVFEYMVKYFPMLKINLEEITYDGRYLIIKLNSITELNIMDENLFYNSFINFLDALIYFERDGSNIEVGKLALTVEDSVESYMKLNSTNYIEYEVRNN